MYIVDYILYAIKYEKYYYICVCICLCVCVGGVCVYSEKYLNLKGRWFNRC